MTDAAHDFHIANATNMVGRELGTSDWLLVDQERVTSFGLATGHDHWLHLDPARAARESPYGGTIVQGFLLVGLILHFIEHMGLRPVDAAFALNYGLDRARFFAPVPVGADGVRVRDRVRLISVEPKGAGRTLFKTGHLIEADLDGGPTPVADIEWLTVWTEHQD